MKLDPTTKYAAMTTFMAVVLLTLASVLPGCGTLGNGHSGPSSPETAFVNTSVATAVYYFAEVREMEPPLSDRQKAVTLVQYANDYLEVMYPRTGYTYLSLANDLSKKLGNGKFSPDIMLIYSLILPFLDNEEIESGVLKTDTATD